LSRLPAGGLPAFAQGYGVASETAGRRDYETADAMAITADG